MKIRIMSIFLILAGAPGMAQVTVTVDIQKDKHLISPFIYGRNNLLSDDPSKPLNSSDWLRIKDAGVQITRENHGNNNTKYNWRLKLESHPDWYNNVYDHDWDYAARSLQTNLPDVQGMWGFQLIGKAASNKNNNFKDWDYYISHNNTWAPARQNLAGGGQPNASGDKALVEGNPSLYLKDWTADSTVGILNHWFGADGIGINRQKALYWNMDNEPEIWSSTHDDVMPVQIQAEEFMQRYFAVAKKARALFPGIKLTGPVTANEWQWYNWSGGISQDGKKYCWLEYFIKRIGEEQKASGIRLLDVLDIHFYPGSTNPSTVLQTHRIYFDKNYDYPDANGVKNISGSWDASVIKEYIFERCREWLIKYIGLDHRVTFGVSETGIELSDPNIVAVWYASTLGEFMKHDVELFTPWTWREGMWEVLHLFSRFNKPYSVQSISGNEQDVSCYTSVSEDLDSMTIVLVNRSNSSKTVSVNFPNFKLENESFQSYTISNLPPSETFVSHMQNALITGTLQPDQNKISVTLPALSIKTCVLKGAAVNVGYREKLKNHEIEISPNPVRSTGDLYIKSEMKGNVSIDVIDISGKMTVNIFNGIFPAETLAVSLGRFHFSPGMYIVKISSKDSSIQPFLKNILIL